VLVTDVAAGVSFLPAGTPTVPQTRRPSSGDIVQKLVEPGRSFDLVVIDTGSVARHPYVQPLAEVVDDIVLVSRAGRSRKEDILAAVTALNINARKIRGTVLTGAAANSA
jgi:Mrp family chromosome partitioning ATPase